ncbi:MAG TPA: molecular chaperone DnaK, partial [Coriobacteriia bacterium]|nr:molecular chaperone DnaK [Coriobacteriia bacterium]
ACEDAIAEVKKALEGDDVDALKAASEKLQETSYKLAEIVYQEAQAASEQAEGEPAGEPAGDEEVADYEVVDEEN